MSGFTVSPGQSLSIGSIEAFKGKLGASPQLECWNIPSFHAAYQEKGRKKHYDSNKL